MKLVDMTRKETISLRSSAERKTLQEQSIFHPDSWLMGRIRVLRTLSVLPESIREAVRFFWPAVCLYPLKSHSCVAVVNGVRGRATPRSDWRRAAQRVTQRSGVAPIRVSFRFAVPSEKRWPFAEAGTYRSPLSEGGDKRGPGRRR
jgi:hypothetical protein